MRITDVGAAVAALALMAASSPAAAQAWIGTMVGNISAAQREAECQRRPFPPPGEVAKATSSIHGLTDRLRQSPAEGEAKDIDKLFASKAKGFKLASTQAYLDQGEFRTLLGSDPAGEWVQLVIAADLGSARGVWRTAPLVEGDPASGFEIGIDLVRSWGKWKILHAQAYPGQAPRVEPYCHSSDTGSF
ncbi:MAG: hypothetical protein KF842_13240 [Caulobacter sp.]|nr:hypothetical protein [Caulobacter sp.]